MIYIALECAREEEAAYGTIAGTQRQVCATGCAITRPIYWCLPVGVAVGMVIILTCCFVLSSASNKETHLTFVRMKPTSPPVLVRSIRRDTEMPTSQVQKLKRIILSTCLN